jgi:hypothetical protein
MRRTPPYTVEEMKGMMEMDPGLRRDDDDLFWHSDCL